jgi:hypothetical protein
MNPIHDGPASPHFWPVLIKGGTDLGALARSETALPQGLSDPMREAAAHAPWGHCVCWGIPFEAGEAVIVADRPVELELEPFKARWLVFMHTSDQRPQPEGPGGIISPVRGPGQLGEHAADYVIRYAGGQEARAAVRRRHQLGAFQRGWGENCFQAVAAHKPYPVRPVGDGISAQAFAQNPALESWGWTQMRTIVPDQGEWVSWLWAWQNPHPELEISGLRFEPVCGVVVVSAVSAGNVASQPLRWEARRKARLILPEGVTFSPEVDAGGLLKQIRLDLGQVISALPRPDYPDQRWADTYNNQLPGQHENELLIEYTAHPEACFQLLFNDRPRIVPAADLESGTPPADFQPVAPARQPVLIRVVERGSGRRVAVKLHIHGQAGEYLPPVDRHRIINMGFFEDYSVDFVHIQSWEERSRSHSCTYIHGETLVKLPLGKVFIEVSKGFEIRPVRKVVEITPATREVVIEIEKVLPWRQAGWVTADTHVHFLSPISAMLEGAAEGVNVINLLASQWGELMTNVGDFEPHNTWGSAEAGGGPEGDGEYLVRVGTENRQHVLGHISLLGYRGPVIAPMTTGGPDESALGDPIEALLTEWARQCRAQGGLVVLPHFPNPRAEHAAALVSGQVDAVEMTSWLNLYDGINPYSISDWYRYLNCGYLVACVGGTDKMTTVTAVGTVRTYARLDPQAAFSYESWKEAVRRAETFVTYGPLLDFMVDGKPMGGRISMPASGGTVEVTWRAASVTVPISRVELVVNGEIWESVAAGPEQAAGSWRVPVERSSWLALLVRGHYPDKPEIIAAHSSPVMVMVEGSPILAAADAVTILEQIEGALAYLEVIGTRAEERAYRRMRLELEAAHRSLHNRLHQEGHYHEHEQNE